MACSKVAKRKRFEGGYELKMVDEDKDLECSICLQLLREAMGTPCSHVFCHGCIQKIIAQEIIGGTTFNCPDCQQQVDSDKVYPNAFVDRLVRRSNVYCSQKNEGCEWIGTLASFFQQHNSECNFRIVRCVYEGCVFFGIKLKIKDHESNCGYRMVQCKHCQAELKFNLLEEHYTSCERIPTSCAQNDCDVIVPKIEIQKHLDQDCAFVIVNCSYAKFGCLEKVLRKDLDRHNKTATNQHMAFMCDQLLQFRSKNEDLQNEIKHLKATNKEIPKLKTEIKELREELNCYCPDFAFLKLLLRGVERWVKKNDNINMEGSYTEWCKNIFAKMEENRLYQFDTSLLVRVKRIESKEICWLTGIEKRGDNMHVVKNDDKLIISTETLHSFNSNNSKMFALHPYDSKNILSESGHEGEDYSGWILKLPDEFYLDGFAIACLMKK